MNDQGQILAEVFQIFTCQLLADAILEAGPATGKNRVALALRLIVQRNQCEAIRWNSLSPRMR
jgi:hypothetical protein